MPDFRRYELELLLSQMKSKASAEWIQDLKTLSATFEKIVHFGCANGTETLALMSEFNSKVAVGVDRNINQAEINMNDLKSLIDESLQALPYSSRLDQFWWNEEVPGNLKEQRFPIFIMEPDIAHPIKPYQISSNSIDLACCSNLLYQIDDIQGEEETFSAIEEMKRVVVNGGLVVANEPDNGSQANLRHHLKRLDWLK